MERARKICFENRLARPKYVQSQVKVYKSKGGLAKQALNPFYKPRPPLSSFTNIKMLREKKEKEEKRKGETKIQGDRTSLFPSPCFIKRQEKKSKMEGKKKGEGLSPPITLWNLKKGEKGGKSSQTASTKTKLQ